MSAQPRELLGQILLALQFLTRLPLPGPDPYTAERMRITPRWFGLVGLGLGALGAALLWAAALIFPPLVALIVTFIALALVTGGLHEDGLADSLDGLGGGRTPERALEIMRDSAIGGYGALGLGLVLALQLASLAALSLPAAMAALVAGQSLSRCAMAIALAQGNYLRAKGSGTGMNHPLSAAGWTALGLSGAAALLPMALVLGTMPALACLVSAALAGLGWRKIYLRKVGGETGDLLGAMQMITATAVYLAATAWA